MKFLNTLGSLVLGCLVVFSSLSAQSIAPSTPQAMQQAVKERATLRANSMLKNMPARNIGPVVQGGRITDLDVDPRDLHTYYVAYASGGLFVTHNNGQTFDPIFDNQGALGIGDIAISPANPDLIWVGTGESNSSRSSYAGIGMFKSSDAGKTWQAAGLEGTHHIGRVIPHPTNPDIAWVGAMGALYTENAERGVYKTTNGGTSWTKTLYIDDHTGIIDMVIDPKNPQRLWAAAWERSRKAWTFDEDGPGSAIYRSDDGGLTWKKAMSGLPGGDANGRFGLAVSPSQPNIVYAFLDNQEVDQSLVSEDTIAGITTSALNAMTLDRFMDLEDIRLDSFLTGKGYPAKYKAATVKKDLKAGTYTLKSIVDYFGDANAALFNTGVKGAEVYRSSNGGDSWTRMHDETLQGVYFTYGYYFGNVRVAPDNPDELYLAGYPLLRSQDGGKSWTRLDTFEIHVDHHALWINPANSKHLILGNDGGLYVSYDRGANWTHINNLPVGQFYTVHVDMQKPYNVYGGLQDNGVLKGSSKSVPNRTKHWEHIFGGDGMFIATDEKNPGLVYTGFQFGNYFRIPKGGQAKYITPKHDLGAAKYRWNWRSPLRSSPHNHEILYFGAQKLFRSMDMGDHWEAISPDLTGDFKPQDNVPYSTLTTISESPLKFGLIWVGADDGHVQVTTDGGNSWTAAMAGLPQHRWVSKVFASPHDKATAFLSMTGYRSDDFRPYVYMTTDYGKSWNDLRGNLPEEPVNCILQDAVNPDLLYLGTDYGTYISLDQGKNWQYLSQIPNVASYDLVVHPRENELVVATHGRSMYVLDVKPLQALADREDKQELMVSTPKNVRWRSNWGEKRFPYSEMREPSVNFDFFVTAAAEKGRTVSFKVLDADGRKVYASDIQAQAGFNRFSWNLKTKKDGYLEKGTYKVQFKMGFEERAEELIVE